MGGMFGVSALVGWVAGGEVCLFIVWHLYWGGGLLRRLSAQEARRKQRFSKQQVFKVNHPFAFSPPSKNKSISSSDRFPLKPREENPEYAKMVQQKEGIQAERNPPGGEVTSRIQWSESPGLLAEMVLEARDLVPSQPDWSLPTRLADRWPSS